MLKKNKVLMIAVATLFASNISVAADVSGLISGKETVVKGKAESTKKITVVDSAPLAKVDGAIETAATAQPVTQDPLSTSLPTAKSPLEETKAKGGLTIDRLAAKQVKLTEMELDMKLEELENKKSGKNNNMSLPAIPSLTRGVALSSVDSLPKIGGDKKEVKKPEEMMPTIAAIYGRSSDLTADVSFDGKTYPLKKGSGSAGGWVISNITTNAVSMTNGKKSKTFALEITQGGSDEETDNQYGGTPPSGNNKVKITLPGAM